MKKLVVCGLAVAFGLSAVADPVELFEKGALIIKPGEGCVTLYSCQMRFGTNDVEKMAKPFRYSAFVPVTVVEGGRFDVRTASALAKSGEGKLSVFLIDEAELPMTLLAPEAKWGAVNIAAVAVDNPDAEKLQQRLEKLVTRVYCELGGALSPAGRKSVLSNFTTLEQLDGVKSAQPSFDLLANMERSMPLLGIKPGRRASYTVACQQGWAPPPKNDLQKKIWDKVHTMPTEPIKIKPETKKVTE